MKPRLFIDTTETGIKEVGLEGKSRVVRYQRKGEDPLARRWKAAAGKELRAYFAGRLRFFSTPCDLGGLPPFTRSVLRITAKIPYGEVRSYRWVAERLGKPRATRAVGNALARNPIPIIIPCHRVVRSDGTLGGYALGLNWKRRLLELEKCHSLPSHSRPFPSSAWERNRRQERIC
ncbi:MAG: methylated-DNA--[protein]-cysteine S-methyltransferase [Candidatus Binatia bacterium]